MYYHSFKIFLRFSLAKITRTIHHNQLLLTIFGTDNVKSAAKLQIIADRGGSYHPRPSASVDNTLRDLHNSFYHINTNEIPGELSRQNLISSHVKISPLLWLQNISRLSHQKLLNLNGLVFHWCLYNK